MKKSVMYQAIVRAAFILGFAQGQLSEARKVLLRLGQSQFQKEAPPHVQSQVEAMQDLDRLEQLILRVTQARSWHELLPAPSKPRRRKSSSH